MRRWPIGPALLVGILGIEGVEVWGANSCVDCHQRAGTVKALPAWYQDQFLHWYGSVHGRKGVTCEKCHGGDPTQTNKTLAHQGVISSSDTKSPVYYRNLPETCGSCHKGVYQQFIQSRHYKKLKADQLAPTCTTCHGFQMDIGRARQLQLAWRCTICHNPQQGVKPEMAELAKQTLQGIDEAEHDIEKAQMAIDLAREHGVKLKGAGEKLGTARDRLKRTGDLWHSFRLGAFKKELTEIQDQAAEVYAATAQTLMKKK